MLFERSAVGIELQHCTTRLQPAGLVAFQVRLREDHREGAVAGHEGQALARAAGAEGHVGGPGLVMPTMATTSSKLRSMYTPMGTSRPAPRALSSRASWLARAFSSP